MSTAPPPPRPPAPPPPPPELSSAQWTMTVTPVVAAVTTLCASLALAGVVEGLRWWGYAGVAVTVVTAVGLGLRAVRTPILLVGLSQMFALLCLLVALFTDSGVFGVLPGPDSLAELGGVLRESVDVVRTGVPPVDATSAVLCLVVIAIGLVAVLVDTLAVSAGTPAACGLVLLCVYAVPASLADEMLPWWAFVLGAVSFAALLAVDGAHRHHQWGNRPTVQGTGGGLGSPTALVSGAVAIALVAGASVTAIGTVGQLPGGSGGGGSDGLGLNPFTSLRGMLDRDGNVELFRVRDLGDEPRYLRALTLAEYDENGGWRGREQMPPGEPTDRGLPLPPGKRGFAPQTVEVDIEPIASEDVWAPFFGTPRRVDGLPAGMRYDPEGGMIYGERVQRLPRYTVDTDLSQPSAEALRGSRPAGEGDVAPVYVQHDGIDEEVVALARDLAGGYVGVYDRTMAIQEFFSPGNGFVYSTETAGGSDEDALTDFLFRSKTGFCEQYASAMAILLRAAGIPSRVAMGYTAGFESGGYRSISTQNAHAWVEVYFPGWGWVQFDPTPLADGTTYTPPYVTESGPSGPEDDPANETRQPTAPSVPAGPTAGPEQEPEAQAGAGGGTGRQAEQPTWMWWTILALVTLSVLVTVLAVAARRRGGGGAAVLAGAVWVLTVAFAAALVSWWLAALVLVLLVAAAPGLVRQRTRRARRHEVRAGGPAAASSAWAELLAESADRGAEADTTETVRVAARRLANQHELDQDGRRALRTVVAEVERSWYGGETRPAPELPPAFDRLIAGLRRTDPLGWKARVLPRSVIRRLRRRR